MSEITAKTGSHKAYPVFVKMLVSALRRTSDSVCVDLLTYSDLEVLKAKRLRRAGQAVPPRPASAAANNKRYLILTHEGEFDRVHYPLPLAFEEFPDPAHLKRTVATLRGAPPVCLAPLACCTRMRFFFMLCVRAPAACQALRCVMYLVRQSERTDGDQLSIAVQRSWLQSAHAHRQTCSPRSTACGVKTPTSPPSWQRRRRLRAGETARA